MTTPLVTSQAPERARATAPRPAVRRVIAGLAALVVLLQVAYPLVGSGSARDDLTVATVVVFFAASVTHAAAWRGARFTAVLLAATAGGGLAVEVLGVATGLPFGAYAYAESLGPQLAGVPLVIPLAWTMMAYPAYVVTRRLTASRWAGIPLAGWALTSWDLYLDPQMVDAGHWAWASSGPAILGIPLSNFAGWFLVATVMMAVLYAAGGPQAGAQPARPDDTVPVALYLWVYGSSLLAHAAFLGLPGSAVLGGVGMGVVAVPLAVAVAGDLRSRARR